MELSILFLLSSIVTARLLEKKKMRMASVAYSVAFIVMLFVLLFVVDIDVIRHTMSYIFGQRTYFNVHVAFLDAIRMPVYGAFIAGAVVLTFVVQLAVTVFCAAQAVVCYCSKKNTLYYKTKRAYIRFVCSVRELYLSQNINLRYCRILN